MARDYTRRGMQRVSDRGATLGTIVTRYARHQPEYACQAAQALKNAVPNDPLRHLRTRGCHRGDHDVPAVARAARRRAGCGRAAVGPAVGVVVALSGRGGFLFLFTAALL